MTPEEVREGTVERFLECEAKRAEARAAALAEGKSKVEAREIAHDAAKRHWNAWAEDMLAERKELDERGAWTAGNPNAETRAWMEKAKTNFSRCLFLLMGGEGTKEASGEDKQKPKEGELPVKSIAIEDGVADFTGFVFPGYARFDSATFKGTAFFLSATFEGGAYFHSATFRGTAEFAYSTFDHSAPFANAIFEGDASFIGATFSESTWFMGAQFGSSESKTDANFTAIKVERAFDLRGAYFSKAPSFRQAGVKQAPDLDGVRFPLPSRWPCRFGDAELIPKYRAIRRMAIQGADYDREQMSFKGELRSRRWTTDKPWHPELWLGIFYDVFADCGRSIFRPALLWLSSVLAFAIFFVRVADQGGKGWAECVARGDAPFFKALYISGRNALVLSSGGKDDRITKAYQCLFGGSIPDGVSFVESFVQVPLSAVLIFLFLLAVKNRFKIK